MRTVPTLLLIFPLLLPGAALAVQPDERLEFTQAVYLPPAALPDHANRTLPCESHALVDENGRRLLGIAVEATRPQAGVSYRPTWQRLPPQRGW